VRRRRFEQLVEQALEELPPVIQRAMENVAMVVEDWPDDELLAEVELHSPYELFGLYQGVPLIEREGEPILPDRIVLFQHPIERACASDEEVVEQVRLTVLHEVGHHLGMREEDLERLGYG
jgi:predicted Zn-dependent protease with MMP-like domain